MSVPWVDDAFSPPSVVADTSFEALQSARAAAAVARPSAYRADIDGREPGCGRRSLSAPSRQPGEK